MPCQHNWYGVSGLEVQRWQERSLGDGNECRCVLLQVEKSPKPVASCAMPAGPGMNIKTDTPLVKKAREGVMEFLLVRVCDERPVLSGCQIFWLLKGIGYDPVFLVCADQPPA